MSIMGDRFRKVFYLSGAEYRKYDMDSNCQMDSTTARLKEQGQGKTKAKLKRKESQNLKSDVESFKWTDDEIQLLLEVVKDYQSIQSQKNLDWMKIRSRYDQIAAKMREEYPVASSEDYPHVREEMTKERVAAKLKKIQAAYKKAVDAKRKSGGGRVVMTFYDICNDIWGGCPSINSLEDGIDSSAVDVDAPWQEASSPSALKDISNLLDENVTANSLLNGSLDIDDELESDTENNMPNTVKVSKDKANEQKEKTNEQKEKTNNRRELINNMLKEQKDKRLARKRGRGDISAQLLDLAKEENAASNKMFAHVEKMDKEYSNHMQRLTTTMETLSNSISAGFATLSQLLLQAPQASRPQQSWSAPHSMHFQGSSHMQQPYQGYNQSASTPNGFATLQRRLSAESEDIYEEQF